MLDVMRTTVEISDSLFAKVRRTMQERGTTLRALVEEGLTHVVAGEVAPVRPSRRAVFPGQPGLAAPYQADDLPRLLQEIRHPRFPALRTPNHLIDP
jgi:hypothetical protein